MTEWGEWAPPPPPATQQYGGVVPPQGDAAIICPHCQTQGSVTTKLVKVKKGISGGKAAGAVLTAGFSVFATGLSRKEQIVELRCGNCRMRWRSA
jgi:transcription elongation factor Elf1